jgi:predicted nucleic acid-binding Zn ribbon protein
MNGREPPEGPEHPFECDKCGEAFSTVEQLEEHVEEEHTE